MSEDTQRAALEQAWLEGAKAAWEATSPTYCAQQPTWTYPLPRRVRLRNPFRVKESRR